MCMSLGRNVALIHVGILIALGRKNDEWVVKEWWMSGERMMNEWWKNDEWVVKEWWMSGERMMNEWRKNDEWSVNEITIMSGEKWIMSLEDSK